MDGWKGEGMYRKVNGLENVEMAGWREEWVDRWMGGGVKERVNG